MDPVTGETFATVLSPTGIPADPPLTAHGVGQANELASHLMGLKTPIDAVYSSPYYRCLQTIAPFVALRNDQVGTTSGSDDAAPLTIRTERGLSEFFGAAPFDHPVPEEVPFLKSLFPEIEDAYQSKVVPSRKGESIEALYQRVRLAVENIIDQCDAEGHRTVILCTHAAVVIALGRVLTGDIPKTVDVEDFGAFTCGLSKFRLSRTGTTAEPHSQEGASFSQSSRDLPSAKRKGRRTGNWICEANSDCSFLSGGQERGWYVPLVPRFAHSSPSTLSLYLVSPPRGLPCIPPHLHYSSAMLHSRRRLTHHTGRSAATRHSRYTANRQRRPPKRPWEQQANLEMAAKQAARGCDVKVWVVGVCGMA